MAEIIREIQLKRTDKGQYDPSISGQVLSEGEVVVSSKRNYFVAGDGTTPIRSLKAGLLTGVPIPYLSQTMFSYTGDPISPVIQNLNTDFCDIGGESSATNVGKFHLTVSLKKDESGNVIVPWQDGTTDSIYLGWYILNYIPSSVSKSQESEVTIKLKNTRNINGSTFDGTKDINNYVVCGTAASTSKKVVSIENYKLVTGAQLRIRMQNSNSASAPTLQVNSESAYPIQLQTNSAYKSWRASDILDVVFDGSRFIVTNVPNSATTAYPGIVTLNDTEYSSSQNPATSRVVDLKCHCYVQSTAPTGKVNRGDLHINDNGVISYYDGIQWKPTHSTWA